MRRTIPVIALCLCLFSCRWGRGEACFSAFEEPEPVERDTIVKVTLQGEECPFADHAEYGIYLPDMSCRMRGVLVLQHGCTMEKFGITRPYDLQYQAFAKKWSLAVVETALYGDCHVWQDPESGSAEGLLTALARFAEITGHPELETAPWLLWGHSGGGYWTLAMLRDHPGRILAAVCYSAAWNPQWDYKPAAAKVPVLLRHAGANDGDPSIFCEATAKNTFAKLRRLDAPVCIACNKDQNHNFSFIRYMAIPFYEAALEQRLPEGTASGLKELDGRKTWLGDPETLELCKESEYAGSKEGLCRFPDETTARNWKEFVATGTVADKTPPPAPYDVKAIVKSGMLEVTWKADADIESGILKFNVYKDGVPAGTLPGTGFYQSFDTNGDNTIPVRVPKMRYLLSGTKNCEIGVETVNHFNLISKRTTCTAGH